MRVIAGRFKGRRLKSPTWDGLRPTSDKLRETLFNVLASRVVAARVFDGYAGTGAIGIEALSRGAAHVSFVERDRRATELIAHNLAACGIEQGYTIQCTEVGAALDAEAGIRVATRLALRIVPVADVRLGVVLLNPAIDVLHVHRYGRPQPRDLAL